MRKQSNFDLLLFWFIKIWTDNLKQLTKLMALPFETAIYYCDKWHIMTWWSTPEAQMVLNSISNKIEFSTSPMKTTVEHSVVTLNFQSARLLDLLASLQQLAAIQLCIHSRTMIQWGWFYYQSISHCWPFLLFLPRRVDIKHANQVEHAGVCEGHGLSCVIVMRPYTTPSYWAWE